MCRSLFAATFTAAAFMATAPAAAYTLSVDGHSALTYEQFRDLEPHEDKYFIWVLPEGGREPEESVVMICSHAHDMAYHEGRRPSARVEECAWRQIGLTANEDVLDDPPYWLYPHERYQFALTRHELENVYARHSNADEIPENEWPAWYQAELTELQGGIAEDREVNVAQNERLDDHEGRISALEEAIDDGVTMIEEAFAFLDNEWRALALVTLFAIIALLLLLFVPRKRNEAAPIAASAPPRTATIPVRSEAMHFRGTIEVPLPPDMEVEQEPAEEAPRPDVPPAAEASPESAPTAPPQAPASPVDPTPPPSSDVEEVWVEDKAGNRHMVRFTRVPGQNGVATRYVNPLTGNLVGQDHLRKHAKEYLKQERKIEF